MKRTLLIFVNGYTRGCQPYRPYWTEKGTQFLDAAALYFNTSDFHFVNGGAPWYSTAGMRFRKGFRYAEQQRGKWEAYENFCFVSHSMGAAFAEGMAAYFVQQGLKIAEIVHFSVADAESIRIAPETASIRRTQLELEGDRTLRQKNRFKWKPVRMIAGVDHYGLLQTDVRTMHPDVSPKDQQNWDFHYDTKTFAVVWEYIRLLQEFKPGEGLEKDGVVFLFRK